MDWQSLLQSSMATLIPHLTLEKVLVSRDGTKLLICFLADKLVEEQEFLRLRDLLHLDVLTVTGRTLGENLDELQKNGFYESCASYLQGTGVAPEDVIRPLEKPLGTDARRFAESAGRCSVAMQ